MAYVVYFNDYSVRPFVYFAGNFKLKWRKAAFMSSDPAAVQENLSGIIHCSKVKEQSLPFLNRIVKLFFVPNGSFIPGQFAHLRIKVTGHAQCRGAIKGILKKVGLLFRLLFQPHLLPLTTPGWVNNN